MPLLIDGHNLIGQMSDVIRLSDSDDEAQLVMLLRKYATRKAGRRVVVVFDNGVYGHPQNLNGYGVECRFAHSPKDADAELIRQIRRIQRKNQWRVVTSDRTVAGEARAKGIVVVSSQDFARQLRALDTPTVCADSKSHNPRISPQEVEAWLKFFGIDEPDTEN